MMEEDIGYRTYKDLTHDLDKTIYPARTFVKLIELLAMGVYFPVVGRFLRCSFVIVCCALTHMRRQRNYGQLYILLLDCLINSTFRKKDAYRWWYLMRFAISVAQERQIHWLVRDILLEDNLILLGNLGPRPLKGYDVAYSFVGYSLWLFERGDIWGAINMVRIAELADETWGYPEYLHGWYGLFTTDVDSVAHFARAVHIDWSFLKRMKHDKMCREHPEVLHEVQRRILVSK
jgi:hypothetical protein